MSGTSQLLSIVFLMTLRHLSWPSCSLKCLPSSFQPKELVGLDLWDSKCEYLWEGAKVI